MEIQKAGTYVGAMIQGRREGGVDRQFVRFVLVEIRHVLAF